MACLRTPNGTFNYMTLHYQNSESKVPAFSSFLNSPLLRTQLLPLSVHVAVCWNTAWSGHSHAVRLCSQTDLLSPSILENHFAILWRRTVWIPDSDSFSFWVPKAFLPPPQPSTDQFASRSFVANIIFCLHWSEISQANWSQLQLSAWHTRREGIYRRDCFPPPPASDWPMGKSVKDFLNC